jgi:hypothetical protein
LDYSVISHEHKCIFVHIQRCAGTSVEHWLVDSDWWLIEPNTKHLLASQAREIYAPWWNDYFKFSIVRDPYTRTLSMLKYAEFFGLTQPGYIDFSGYRGHFGSDVVIEHDYRFYEREKLLRPEHRPGCVYGNILDEPLDFVGRYETLAQDMAFVAAQIGKPEPFASHEERSAILPGELVSADIATVNSIYRDDFERFGYERRQPESAPAAWPSGEKRSEPPLQVLREN